MIDNTCPACGQIVPEDSGLVIDHDRAEIRFRGMVIQATSKEFAILAALVKARGRAVTKENLLKALYWDRWGKDEPEMKIIDVFVCKLRKKIKPAGLGIKTHWGRGYELVVPGQASREQPASIDSGDVANLTYGAR